MDRRYHSPDQLRRGRIEPPEHVSGSVSGPKEAGELLRRLRVGAGVSQMELARRTGVQQGSISRIENSVVSPTLFTFQRLAAAIGYEVRVDFVRYDPETRKELGASFEHEGR